MFGASSHDLPVQQGGAPPDDRTHTSRERSSTLEGQRSGESTSVDLSEVLKLQSLLMQFIHPQVRSDFLCGLLNVQASKSLLSDLDRIRAVIIPPWRGSSTVTLRAQLDLSREHLMSLVRGTTDIFDLQTSSTMWTYGAWAKYLDQISSADYWKHTPAATFCIERLAVDTRNVNSAGVPQRDVDVELKPSRDLVRELSPVRPNEDLRPRSSSPRFQPARERRMPKKKCIEGIQLTDSSQRTSSADDSESSTDAHHRRRGGRRASSRVQREPVKPLPFQPDKGLSLRSFLTGFEKYFYAKYEGNSRDCTQELSAFLTGDLKEFYEALGGRRLKFPEMKEKLLSWYKTRRVGGSKYWRDQLQAARMKPGENVRLYGARLQELGQKAFPHSERDCLREMRHHFLQTIPSEISRRIRDGESVLRLVDGRAKMTWSELIDVADRTAQENREFVVPTQEVMRPSQVWFSREDTNRVWEQSQRDDARRGEASVSLKPGLQRDPQESSAGGRDSPVTSRQRGRASSANAPRRRSPLCHWCGRKGHEIGKCWEKLGACLICGNLKHAMDDCPRYRVRQTLLKCPRCSGTHAGNKCTAARQLNC
jgi:hypothetical protein